MLGSSILISIPSYFFTRWRITASTLSSVRKLLAEGSNHSILGWRELELVNDRLRFTMELIEGSYDLRAIEKIVGNEHYTFVYVSSLQALIIPMTLYPEDEYRTFVAELRDAWEDRDAPPLAEETDAASARPADARIAKKPF